LIKARALQSAILNSANFAIIATDPQGVIQLFNVGAERMLGYTAGQLIDKAKPSELSDPDEVLARAQALSLDFGVRIAPGFEALAFKASRGIEDIYELTYICADGERLPAIVSITALSGEFGEIIGYLLIGSPNAIRKRVERELAAAIAVAEQANRAKSEFLSCMSHELRTPLNAILGFAQLIETGLPAPTALQLRSVGQILKAGWYLLDLINEILDLTMIESGKMSLSLEPIRLSGILRESEDMIEPQASKRGIRLSFPPPAMLAEVTADHTRLKQVLINLLSNAVKYNRDGGTVTVRCIPVAAGRIRISIADTGLGLSPEDLGQLFQPFNRIGQEAHVGEGTGIGLVMSKRLVGLMGGDIGVESTVGSGSVFWIELNAVARERTQPGVMAMHTLTSAAEA
jgi:signal transduction histidine kinase